MLISILLPVYNSEKTISETINSLLCQTVQDFELIIINDASNDSSEDVIMSYSDTRIRYYRNEKNMGLIYTLNRGIRLAEGKYIARMDSDDIALPTRLEKQLEVMEKYPEIIVCGTGIETFGNVNKRRKILYPEHDKQLKECLIRRSCFAHPTVLIRRSVLVNNNLCYDKGYRHAEDYKLWIDLSDFGAFYNIPEVLLYYRMSETQITSSHKEEVANISKYCRREYISKLFKDDVLDKEIANGITLKTIRRVRKYHSISLLEVLYLSLSRYSLKELCYFLFTLDAFRFSFKAQLTVFKRFVFGKKSLL